QLHGDGKVTSLRGIVACIRRPVFKPGLFTQLAGIGRKKANPDLFQVFNQQPRSGRLSVQRLVALRPVITPQLTLYPSISHPLQIAALLLQWVRPAIAYKTNDVIAQQYVGSTAGNFAAHEGWSRINTAETRCGSGQLPVN